MSEENELTEHQLQSIISTINSTKPAQFWLILDAIHRRVIQTLDSELQRRGDLIWEALNDEGEVSKLLTIKKGDMIDDVDESSVDIICTRVRQDVFFDSHLRYEESHGSLSDEGEIKIGVIFEFHFEVEDAKLEFSSKSYSQMHGDWSFAQYMIECSVTISLPNGFEETKRMFGSSDDADDRYYIWFRTPGFYDFRENLMKYIEPCERLLVSRREQLTVKPQAQ
jgi:hypothetical protein